MIIQPFIIRGYKDLQRIEGVPAHNLTRFGVHDLAGDKG